MIAFTVVVWLVTLAKAPALWRNRTDRLTRAYWLALASLTTAMTLDQPPIYVAVGERLHLDNIAFPLDYGGGVLAARCTQTFLWYAHGSPDAAARVRRRTAVTVAVLGVLAVTYVTGLSRLANSHDIAHDPARNWGELVMRLTLAGWAAWALGDIIALALRFARRAASAPLRIGLRWVAVGAVLAMVRMVGEYGPYALISWRHAGQSAGEHLLIRLLNLGALLGFALMAAGFCLPALARVAGAARLWLVDLRHYRQLAPLWRAVAPSVPTLDWPRYRIPLAHQIPLLALRGRLYRRIIEVQDGYFALEPYRDPDLERELRADAGRLGLDPRATHAFVDAAAIRDAAARFRAGIPPGAVPTGTDRTLTEDVRYLVQVASYLTKPADPRRATAADPNARAADVGSRTS